MDLVFYILPESHLVLRKVALAATVAVACCAWNDLS
jgi:hypothetical protein